MLQPAPAREERRHISVIYRAAGLETPSMTARPVREAEASVPLGRFVHAGAGGRWLGEFGLASYGVLLLRDIDRFEPGVLERIGTILGVGSLGGPCRLSARSSRATPQLLATMTSCPCGHLGNPYVGCKCTDVAIAEHGRKIPPAFRALFDVTMALPFVEPEESSMSAQDTLNAEREVVRAAWDYQEREVAAGMSTRLTGDALVSVEAFARPPVGGEIGVRLIRVAASIADLSATSAITDTDIRAAAVFVLPASTFVEDGG